MTSIQKMIAAASLVAVYFFTLTHQGLHAWFTIDDLTNIQFLHGEGQRPFSHLLAHCLVVMTPEYRPLGGVVYRMLYAAFGLDPLPFRIVCYALLVLNLIIASAFFYRLSHSGYTAAVGTLVFSVHTCMAGLYFNTGTLYDILCFAFGIAGLIVYAVVRESGTSLRGSHFIAFLILFSLALDSKEMAITLPLILVLYECVYRSGDESLRARFTPVAWAALVSFLFAFIKTQVPNEMSITSLYIPRFSLSFLIEQLCYYYSLLVSSSLSAIVLGACLALLLLVAIAFHNRHMIFGFLFANIALLPLLVIPGRGGFVWYIPFAGWALYAGAFLDQLVEMLARRIPSERFRTTLPALCFLSVLAILFIGQRENAQHMGDSFLPQENYLKSLYHSITLEKLALAPGSRVLIQEDPLGPIDWSQLFLIRLTYDDASLWVDRPAQMGRTFDPSDLSIYNAIVHSDGTGIRVLRSNSTAAGGVLPIAVSPASVNRNNEISLRLPGATGCQVDVEYRMPEDELARSGLWKNWCTVGADGSCTARIDQDAERGVVDILRVRTCQGVWQRASGSFEILP